MPTKTEWSRSIQAERFARQRMRQIDTPDRITFGDEENCRRWARIMLNATTKSGPHMFDEAKAKDAARAHVRMRVRTDGADPNLDPAASAEAAFDAGLRLYLRMLAGDVPPAPERPRRGAVVTIADRGSVVHSDYFCPNCAVQQRQLEEQQGNRWPESWEHCAVTGSVQIREVRASEGNYGRCAACQSEEEPW